MNAAPFDHPLHNWTGPPTLAAVLALAALAVSAYRPPAPEPAVAPDTMFSAARALPLVDVLAAAPRPVGSAAHDSVRAFLLGRLRALGLEVDTQTVDVVRRWPRVTRVVRVRNVLGVLRGRDPTGSVLLVAHYDGVPGAPAAADDGAGVASILEAVRALRARGPLRNDVVVLFSDGEELGLMGARAYAAAPWPARPAVVLNLEARGDAGPSLMFETGPHSGGLVRRFSRTRAPLASSLFQEIYRRMPNDTDLSVFAALGYPGLNFANGERGAYYHTPLDAPRNLSPRTVQQQGDRVLALVKDLGQADLPAVAHGGDPVYFYVPGLGLAHYGAGWAVPLALLLVALLVVLALRAVRRGRARAAGILAGFGAALLNVAAAAGVAALLWAAVRGAHPEWGTLVGAALYREGPYVGAVVSLAVAVVVGVFQLLRRWFTAAALALGALLLPTTLSVVTAFMLPRASHVLLWPTVFALGMLALQLRRPEAESGTPATTGFMLMLAPGVLLLMAPILWLVSVFLGIAAAPVIAAVTAVTMLLLLPLLDGLGRPARWWLPAAGVAAAAVLVGVGLAGAGIDARRPHADQLVYVVDPDSARAWWTTADPAGEPWSGRFVGPAADSVYMARLSLMAFYAGRAQRAPVLDVPRARATVVADTVRNGRRVVTLDIAWSAGTVTGAVGPRAGARLVAAEATGAVGAVGAEGPRSSPVSGSWRVERWVADAPFRLTVDVPADSAVELRLESYRQGLPRLAGAPPLQRPADRMAAPRRVTDVTVVREIRRF